MKLTQRRGCELTKAALRHDRCLETENCCRSRRIGDDVADVARPVLPSGHRRRALDASGQRTGNFFDRYRPSRAHVECFELSRAVSS